MSDLAARLRAVLGSRLAVNATTDPAGFPIDMERPILLNPDGSFSTERSMTEQVGDRWYNFPTIWEGQELDPDTAYRRFMEEHNWGRQFPNFSTLPEAESAAVERSRTLERLRAPDALKARKAK